MKFRKYSYFLIFTLLLLSSCDRFVSTKIVRNDNEDIDKAGQYTMQFYELVDTKNYDSLFSYFNVSERDTSIQGNFILVESIMGKFLNMQTETIASERVTQNGKTSIRFYINMTCDYEKGKTQEYLELNEIDGKIYFKANNIDFSRP
jgi:hypothetical protein